MSTVTAIAANASGTLMYLLQNGIGLGSLLATVPNLLLALFVLYRTITEDRVLRSDLPGYAEYATEVRSRLIPGVW